MVLLEKLGKLFKRCASAEPEFWLPGSESGEGALVFWDYGWDMLDWMKEAGFSDAYLQPYYSRFAFAIICFSYFLSDIAERHSTHPLSLLS